MNRSDLDPSSPTHTAPPQQTEVLVVGGGLAGLACARSLLAAGREVHLIEASDAVGGRARTDLVDGFRLDRGFQVMLTAYSELPLLVDLSDLDLRAFGSGSLIWTGSSIEELGDPWRNPRAALSSAMARVGSLGDKLKVAKLRASLTSGSDEDCFKGVERTTLDELRHLGFSEEFIDQFFRPFFGGVFLERDLETTSYLMRYYFRCFALGDAVVPAKGIQQLPDSLAGGLSGRVSLGTMAESVSATSVTLTDGSALRADRVVVATDGAGSARLLGGNAGSFKSTVTSYFAAEQAPVEQALLLLDGEGTGPANHVAVMSNVSEDYAPDGQALIAVSGVGASSTNPGNFETGVIPQLRRWLGSQVDEWRLLRTYHIPHALPNHPPGGLPIGAEPVRRDDGVLVAGDHMAFGSIQGALRSGRLAAEQILAE